ncbi:hypothetical protein BT63DRAFT_425327 [Microthyrium microscopicum]|uniref:MARVEL domain-containing protein n=1 Tax=Microthyrium microscopicum TaxID=703497 RepID=A0A6A6UDE2_9PEZI|nr:hypothetical protein BT63DRAFT_425327 [Microthyrium microscopicum]
MKFIIGGLRFFQIIFSAVILGLSINLAKGQAVGKVPATTGYGSFTGAFGIIAGTIGVAAIFVELLDGVISWVIDILAALITVASGIAFTLALKGTNCGSVVTLYDKSVLNCGTVEYQGTTFWTCGAQNSNGKEEIKSAVDSIESRCRMATADEVFMYMTFAVVVAALVVSFMNKRRKGASTNYVI